MATTSSLQAARKRGTSQQQGLYPSPPRLILILLPLLLTVASATRLHKKQTIAYYLHNVFNASAFTILPPLTPKAYTGWVNMYDNLITQGPDASSKKLGTMSGLEVETSTAQPFSAVLLLNTINYDDGVYKGSITQQGVLNYNEADTRIAVVGGTGDFLGVYGYGERTFISTSLVEGLNTSVVYYKTYLYRS